MTRLLDIPCPFSLRRTLPCLFYTFIVWTSGCAQSSGNIESTPQMREFSHVLPPVFTDNVPSVEFSIPVTNDTARAVRFDVVSNSCSCTKSQLKQSHLAPGESTILDARINFHREVGLKNVSILLRNEDGPTWCYNVEVNCYRRILLPLSGVLSLGEVTALEVFEKRVPVTTYSRPDQRPLVLTEAHSTDDRIHVEFRNADIEKLPDGVSINKGTLNVRLTAVPRTTVESSVIEIVASNGADEFREKLQVHWQISPVFEISPSRVFFHQANASQESSEKRIEISRKDGKPFSVTSTSGSDAAFEITVLPLGKPASKVDVVVALSAQRPDRNVWSKLCLETDAADQRQILIPISGLFKIGGAP